jgi:hypothetical protein
MKVERLFAVMLTIFICFIVTDVYILFYVSSKFSFTSVAWRSITIAFLVQVALSVALPYCVNLIVVSEFDPFLSKLLGAKFRVVGYGAIILFVLGGVSVTMVYTAANCPNTFLPTVRGAGICPAK